MYVMIGILVFACQNEMSFPQIMQTHLQTCLFWGKEHLNLYLPHTYIFNKMNRLLLKVSLSVYFMLYLSQNYYALLVY